MYCIEIFRRGEGVVYIQYRYQQSFQEEKNGGPAHFVILESIFYTKYGIRNNKIFCCCCSHRRVAAVRT